MLGGLVCCGLLIVLIVAAASERAESIAELNKG